MDNKKDNIEVIKKGNILLEDRKNLSITGVVEIISFNDEKVLLNTVFKKLEITGNNLKVAKLDIKNGEVLITGNIYGCVYLGDISKTKTPIFKKLIGKK